MGGCADDKELKLGDAQMFLNQWFQGPSETAKPVCHAFGELMFPAASCDDMYEHAKLIDPTSRRVDRINPLECFGYGPQKVCGDFVEVWYRSKDLSGRDIKEGVVVKRDDGVFRLYWYRSDLLFTTLADRSDNADSKDQQADNDQTLLESTYNQMVAEHPELYQYPPCLNDIRVSSSTMVGKPIKLQHIRSTEISERAARCAVELCFALVGQKLTTLCPREHHD